MYLDPGFGSMLIQALVASIAAIAVGLGIFRYKIKTFFSKNKNVEDGKTSEEPIESTEMEIDSVGEDSND